MEAKKENHRKYTQHASSSEPLKADARSLTLGKVFPCVKRSPVDFKLRCRAAEKVDVGLQLCKADVPV
jgi:hypothetical protein